MIELFTSENIISFFILAVLEVILGIDNVIFVSIIIQKLKTEKDATGSFKSQQQSLIKDIYNSLLEKEEKDKNIVLNNLHLFDEATIKKALSGELSKSLEYSSVLQKYICN